MANSYVEIPVTGVDSYTFPFPYIEQSHISVSVGGVPQTLNTHYTFTDSNTIEFTAGNVPSDTSLVVNITRSTSGDGRLVNFSNTGLDADDLNLASNQNFYLAQEAVDAASLNITKGLDGLTDVSGRLTNVTDPVDSQDAATKAYVASQMTASANGSVTVDSNAPTTAVAGDLWVDTSTNVMYVYTGSSWANGATVESQEFRFTGSQMTVINGNHIIVDFTVGTANIREVFLNGVRLQECTTALDFTTGDWDRSTSLIAFDNALAADDEIVVTTTAQLSTALANAVTNVNFNMNSVLSASQNALDAETAKTDAETAKTDAQTAKTDAESAKTDAETAQGLAEDARDDAIVAKDAAELAAAGVSTVTAGVIQAENARDAAITAQGLAEDAKDDSVTAQGLSESARDASVVAKDASVVAQGLSESARDASVVAKDAAVVAQGLAETAKTDAETAKTDAQTAQGLAETAKTDAETAKTDAETAAASIPTLVWANFNGSSFSSGASITTGVFNGFTVNHGSQAGRYDVTFSSAMVDTNYAVMLHVSDMGSTLNTTGYTAKVVSKSTTGFSFAGIVDGNFLYDFDQISIQVIR